MMRMDNIDLAEMSYAEGLHARLRAIRQQERECRERYNAIPVMPGTYERMQAEQRRLEELRNEEAITLRLIDEIGGDR